MISMILAAAISAAPVSYDAESHSVTFTATAVGMPTSAPIEFLFAGAGSDHDYESLFLTDANPADIAKAFEKAGIAVGNPVDVAAARFWPVGCQLEMDPSFESLLRETHGEPLVPAIYTGGQRDANGQPDAATNMPMAVFALYSMPQSLIQLDDALDQSVAYGRFRPAEELKKGERRTFKFTLKKDVSCIRVSPRFEPGKLADALGSIKEAAKPGVQLDVTPSFSPELTIAEASGASAALSTIDSRICKMNGFPEAELFYQAYLPKESWRDRKERLCQPPEVHLKPDGSCAVTEILEDWSGEGTLDPKLTIKDYPYDADAKAGELVAKLAARTQTVLVYASSETKLARLYALKAAIKEPVRNWYIFTE